MSERETTGTESLFDAQSDAVAFAAIREALRRWVPLNSDESGPAHEAVGSLIAALSLAEKESKTLRNEVGRLRSGSEIPALREMISAQVEEIKCAEDNRDQWHSAANQYHETLEELLPYARGNPVVLGKIHKALGIS